MEKNKICTIKLLNKSFDIKCPPNEMAHLKKAAEKLNAHMIDKKKQLTHLDDYQILLLAALHVSHDLIKSEQHQEESQRQLGQLIDALESKINLAHAEESTTFSE